jgi:hypothetical protein
MAATTITIPKELYRRLQRTAQRNATTTEVELVRYLERALTKPPRRGRPRKEPWDALGDVLLDYLVALHVLSHPNRRVSDVIRRLQKAEPFKSAGDLRRRYNRLPDNVKHADSLISSAEAIAPHLFKVVAPDKEPDVKRVNAVAACLSKALGKK